MLAILVATLTVGLGAAAGLHALPNINGSGRSRSVHDCQGCGRLMVEIHSVWVCARCDRVG
jgi:ribosomal protein L37AE/L43A